jgi:hypothetical protein
MEGDLNLKEMEDELNFKLNLSYPLPFVHEGGGVSRILKTIEKNFYYSGVRE